MRILFLMQHPGYMRYYCSVVKKLLEGGSTVHIGFNYIGKQLEEDFCSILQSRFGSAMFSYGLTDRRRDFWKGLYSVVTWWMDYLRYFTTKFKHADRLKYRVEIRIHPMVRYFCHKINSDAGVNKILRLLKTVFEIIPPSMSIRRYIKRHSPDIILVSPLVTAGSHQADFIRAAKYLGIKTIYTVASWDNLTSKGLIKGGPDKVIVWNSTQRQEAVEYHSINEKDVIITGAQHFDEIFDMKPSVDREKFCIDAGIDSKNPYLLYMCSSNFVAPNEVKLVEKWIEGIRNSGNQRLAHIGIIIRPYPKLFDKWASLDLTRYGNISIWPKDCDYPVTGGSRQIFFDSIYHSIAIVGVNTTGLIEAAIIGRPVFSIIDEELNNSSSDSIHYQYLLRQNGGFVEVSIGIQDHIRQLEVMLESDRHDSSAMKEFVERFIRPRGLERGCTEIFINEVENICNRGSAKRSCRSNVLAAVFFPIAIVTYFVNRLNSRGDKQWGKIAGEAERLGVDPVELWKAVEEKN